MSQYDAGTVNVINGDATIIGVGTLWLAEIVAGQHFSLQGQGNPEYTVLSVTSDTALELTTTYAGDTASAQAYSIFRDFTPNYNLPILSENVVDTHRKMARLANVVDTELGVAQTNIDNGLAGKSDTTHNHDTDYSDTLHNHDTDYLLSDGTDSIVGVDLDITNIIKAGLSSNGTEVLSVGKNSLEDWGDGYSVFQIGGNASLLALQATAVSSLLNVTHNGKFDGTNWKYISTDEAAQYKQANGEHVWMIAVSGAAGAAIAWVEVMRTNISGALLIGKTASNISVVGSELRGDGKILASVAAAASTIVLLNRISDDGTLIDFRKAGISEGSISVSGTTVSYNSFCGSHWSQLSDMTKTAFTKGTVVETIDEMCEWTLKDGKAKDNDQLVKFKVSDTAGSKRVYGIFEVWDKSDNASIHALGATTILVTGACEGGDLLESNGDGTARVQADDIIRSSTIGKVTMGDVNGEVSLVPCVLYCG